MSGTRFSTGKVKGVSERKLNLFHEAAAEVKVKKKKTREKSNFSEETSCNSHVREGKFLHQLHFQRKLLCPKSFGEGSNSSQK